jgi:hypothetical protein
VIGTDGSGLIQLTNSPSPIWNYGPRWSPDGRHIAFTSNRDGTIEIYVMNADGSAQTRLTNGGRYPDGAQQRARPGGPVSTSAPHRPEVPRAFGLHRTLCRGLDASFVRLQEVRDGGGPGQGQTCRCGTGNGGRHRGL